MTMWVLGRHPAIPGYEPIRVLGQNGAIVYVVRSARFDKPVVLQVWSNRPLPSNAAILIGLEHPNIVRVLDVGEVPGHSYFAFEYVDADSLAQRLENGPLPDTEARASSTAIASALQFAREAHAVVADLTPATVLLTEPLKIFLHPAAVNVARPDFAPPEATAAALSIATEMANVYRLGAPYMQG